MTTQLEQTSFEQEGVNSYTPTTFKGLTYTLVIAIDFTQTPPLMLGQEQQNLGEYALCCHTVHAAPKLHWAGVLEPQEDTDHSDIA